MAATIRDLKTPGASAAVLDHLKNFGATFDAWFLREGGEQHRAPGLHPSEISCLRKAVYSLLGTERKGQPPRTWKWRFWHGHAIHDRLQATFQKFAAEYTGFGAGVVEIEDEVEISASVSEAASRWGIVGHADACVTVRPEPGADPVFRAIIEIKSKSGDEFEAMKRPEEPHLDQATIYQACLDIPVAWILYFDKGTQNFTRPEPPYVTTFQGKRWRALEARFAQAHDAVRTSTLPDREEGIHCSFCAFRWTCNPEILKKRRRREQPPMNLRWRSPR